MAQITQFQTNFNLQSNLLACARELDQHEWNLESFQQADATNKNALLGQAHQSLQNVRQYISSLKHTLPIQSYHQATQDFDYIEKKITHLSNRIVSLQSAGLTVTHQQFTHSAVPANQSFAYSSTNSSNSFSQNNPVIQQGPQMQKARSFSVVDTGNVYMAQTPNLSTLQMVDRLNGLLKQGFEHQAIAEFNALPGSIQQTVYEALWLVRGKPQDGNPIAHDNFGEVSFKNQEPRCYSTPQQKVRAIELAKIPAALHMIVDAFEKNNTSLAVQILNTLPSQVKNELYGKYWEISGKPNISNFGETFVDPTQGDVNKKAETVKAYLNEYRGKINTILNIVGQKQEEWEAIDRLHERGSKKNDYKRDSLDAFAKAVVPLFIDLKSNPVNRPAAKGNSYPSLAEAYAEAYPCLRPFLLQLISSLTISSDGANGNTFQDMPKSSTPIAVNLSSPPLDDSARKAYRTGIWQETYQTLQQGYYINSKGKKFIFKLDPAIQSLSQLKDSGGSFHRSTKHQTKIFLDNQDCLTVTGDCVKRGLSTIVLDAASDDHFGGEYKTGAGAQEENMCRRTGLSVAVDPSLSKQTQNFYPISNGGPSAGLYVSNVPVFRGEEREGYPYLDQPFETAVGIFAAHNFNEDHQRHNGVPNHQMKKLIQVNGENRLPPQEATETKEKLRAYLQMAENNNHDAVVIVAIGCGAFRNPPKHVCEMAMELITQEFPKSFKEIHFTVIDDHNTGKAHNPKGNYIVFKETISGFSDKMRSNGTQFTIT